MFKNLANFFIQNWKLTSVLVLITLLVWIWSYLILPKQYNPAIVVPAFNIVVPAPWLDNIETSKLIISPLENKLMEIEWIDEVYWIAWDNYAWVMVKFNVWEDKEKAKIRLLQKIDQHMDLSPIWALKPIVESIDPDELSQITYSITSNNNLTTEDNYIYLRQIAKIIEDKVKTIDNLTTIEIVWWLKKNIIINLDIDSIEARNTDIMQVYDVLLKNNLSLPANNINLDNWDRIFVEIDWKIDSIERLNNIVISKVWDSIVYLGDIAQINYWTRKIKNSSTYNWREAVFIGFWKAIWTNAVFLTDEVKQKIEEIKKELPNNIELNIIQNEWDTARNATNDLLINLFTSIIIVFIVLTLYLGKKDAFNTAVSIPLTLWLVFFIALIIWDNINRITLFALILVLWMLVDNSTVVVENISRHLNERSKTWKTKLNAVLEATQEVWFWVIMATVSRLIAFWAMFAVWGMMWEFMWPIPKYVIMALLISLLIAFTINPWLSYLWAANITESDNKIIKKKKVSKFDIRKYYLNFMNKFINNKNESIKKRKWFKITFWLLLLSLVVWPMIGWIFKARLLPKSNQNQIYLWVDWPRSWGASKMLKVENDINDFLLKNKYIKETSSTIWQAFIWDFANLFRWWLSRVWENQISMRINLYSPDEYSEITWESRINSELFTINLRPDLNDYIYSKYPDLQTRLLEDPPGPPVRSTFLAKIKSNASDEDKHNFVTKIENEVKKLAVSEKLEDIWNSNSTTYRKLKLEVDHESISRAWLTVEQVANSLAIWINWKDISLVKNNNSFESTNIVLWIKNSQVETTSLIKNINLTNSMGQKIPLSSLININYTFVWDEINTDKREKTDYIYWEMGDNSIAFFMKDLIPLLLSDNFVWDEYIVDSWWLYSIEYIWLKDWKKYILEWWGEWELTLDTFRDLWLAMWIALLAIYFLLVWQFASFSIAWIIMITFLLSFFGIFPWFAFLYLIQNEYFSATSMIGIIALWWIVVWNAIILIDYIKVLKENWLTIEDALLKAWYVRFAPIILTSLTTVFWAATIISDPVWSWLAWSIIWWLLVSSILTLIVIPIFYYDSQKKYWK